MNYVNINTKLGHILKLEGLLKTSFELKHSVANRNTPPLQASSGLNQQKLAEGGFPPGKVKDRPSGLKPPVNPSVCVGESECVGTRRSPSLSNTT